MMFNMSLEEVRSLASAAEEPFIPELYIKTKAETTPLKVYTALSCEYGNRYLLESVEKEKRHARFSFLGGDPECILTVNGREISIEGRGELLEVMRARLDSILENGEIKEDLDLLDALGLIFPAGRVRYHGRGLHNLFARQVFTGGLIGYLAYDIVYDCWLGTRPGYDRMVPDVKLLLQTKNVIFDHREGEIYLVFTPFFDPEGDVDASYMRACDEAEALLDIIEASSTIPDLEPSLEEGVENLPAGESSMTREEYEDAVRIAKRHIIDGDIFQVVLSRLKTVKVSSSPLKIYKALRRINPSPYMYLFELDGLGIVGASPETLLTVHRGRVITNPIAGTCPRGKDEREDKALAERMLADEKERAEHVMLVDLGRNDVRMVSKPGSVRVDDFMSVIRYSHVQHIESTVSGEMRDECTVFDATRAIFPAGTLSGAPKIRAMEIIDELERGPRGIYGGGIGYFTWNGDCDLAIAIRTIVLRDGVAYIQAGAGIVADSDPEKEFYETERKMGAMMRAIGAVEGGR
ncbi:MAG: anthranilate synthase component I [Candidatus Syntrophoarchaeum sp. WYZ-LMO15]|nr:MAG: anthranilate synthase component I [Candidatus Syntrophoarchaeum sp. WYZ-LMO15]